MTEIKSVNAPAIGQAGVERLFHLTREKHMTPEGGAFQAGYEQAKRDFRNALNREVGIPAAYAPNADKSEERPSITIPADERRARKAGEDGKRWWHL
jgi:hypothetical protein